MSQHPPGRRHATVWVTILTAVMCSAPSPESRATDESAVDPAAQQLVAELLDISLSAHYPPLTFDAEHARTIDPVLTEGTAVWIHEDLPSPPLTVIGGRVFSYRDVLYDPLDAPVLKIRAIDDDQVIPFLVRVVVRPDAVVPANVHIDLGFPAPPIFDPRVGYVAAWVDSDRAQVTINRSFEDSLIGIRLPLSSANSEGDNSRVKSSTVIVEGELRFGKYKSVSGGRFGNIEDASIDPAIAGLSRLELDRDVAEIGDREQLQEVAYNLASSSTTDYQRVLAVNSWVSRHLRYLESPATRSPLDVLQDRSGDCDDYTAVTVALLRTMGIPALRATGLLYDFDTLAAHAWVEVALPTRDGDIHWFICDPTLAGTTPLEDRKAGYVQFKDRILLYPLRPTVSVEGLAGRRTIDILLNWRAPSGRSLTEPRELNQFIDLVIEAIDREISGGAERLAEAGQALRRESASIAGSPYLVFDRPVVEEASSRFQLRLENEERLVLDLVAENTSALESKADLDTIDRMRAAYTDLNDLFFAGMKAHHNLELVFSRDPHSDRLQSVSLRFGRYLVEHYLDRILKRLSKGGLLTKEETARISAIAETSGGKNLYALQELARQSPARESFSPGTD